MTDFENTPKPDEGRPESPAPNQDYTGVAPGMEAEPSPPPAQETRPRSWLYRLFSPETRTGRVLRPVLRFLGVVVGLFALGLLAAYLLLYQPAARSLQATRADLHNAQQTLDQTRSALENTRQELEQLRSEHDQLQSQLETADQRIRLMRFSNQVSAAQVALAKRDNSAVQKALQTAQDELDTLLPALQEQDPDVATQIESRFKLIRSEAAQDTKTAQSDLEILSSTILLYDQTLSEIE
ncbi:MAG: hypothetical protein GYA17_22285 [Chloroflexi bacterium]|jgi:septal ring factor EnvC (AmiA/AmiB activator)|nr:hypothetical protein [Chloroflexota bacterium]